MAIPSVTSVDNINTLRPRDNVNPKYKQNDPQYSLEWSQYIYSNWKRGNSVIKQSDINRIREERLYADGKQTTEKYRNWIYGGGKKSSPTTPPEGSDTHNVLQGIIGEDIAEENINFDEVFSPAPKYVRNIVGIMRSQDHDVTVESEDESSGILKEDAKYLAWMKEEFRDFMIKYNTGFDIPNTEKQNIRPSSQEEMELFDNIGSFKLPYEIGMEKIIAHTEHISKFDSFIKDNVVADLVSINCSAVGTFQNSSTGKFEHEWIDVENLILQNSDKPDFSDSTWGGRIKQVNVIDIRLETGWDEDTIYALANNVKGMFGNSEVLDTGIRDDGTYDYDNFKIPVLHSYWKTIDSEFYTDRKTDKGVINVYEPYRGKGKGRKPKIHNSENRKTSKTDLRRLYQCKWVLDSDKVYGYGIVPNSGFNYGTHDVEYPIRFYKIKGKSIIRTMIPILDQIYLTFIKTQNAIAKAPPPGLAIEMGAIENITWGNKKLRPKDVIKIYTLSGNIIYRLKAKGLVGAQGKQSYPSKPVEELRGGLGTAVTDGIQAIEFFYRQLDTMTGIDGISSANVTPSRETGKAVTELAVASTSNVLKPIYSGYISLKEDSARVVGWQVQSFLDAYDNIEECPYYMAIGRANLTAIKTASDFPPVAYGFRIEARATEQEKALVLQAAREGLAGGKNGIPALKFSEYSFIQRYLSSGRSIKYIELWMAKKEQEAEAMAAQKAEQAQRIQGEENRKQEEAKRQSEQEKVKAELNKEITVIAKKGEEERKTLDVKYKYELQLADINSNNNINQQQ